MQLTHPHLLIHLHHYHLQILLIHKCHRSMHPHRQLHKTQRCLLNPLHQMRLWHKSLCHQITLHRRLNLVLTIPPQRYQNTILHHWLPTKLDHLSIILHLVDQTRQFPSLKLDPHGLLLQQAANLTNLLSMAIPISKVRYKLIGSILLLLIYLDSECFMRLNIATKKLLRFMPFLMVVSFNWKLPQRSHVSGFKKRDFFISTHC